MNAEKQARASKYINPLMTSQLNRAANGCNGVLVVRRDRVRVRAGARECNTSFFSSLVLQNVVNSFVFVGSAIVYVKIHSSTRQCGARSGSPQLKI